MKMAFVFHPHKSNLIIQFIHFMEFVQLHDDMEVETTATKVKIRYDSIHTCCVKKAPAFSDNHTDARNPLQYRHSSRWVLSLIMLSLSLTAISIIVALCRSWFRPSVPCALLHRHPLSLLLTVSHHVKVLEVALCRPFGVRGMWRDVRSISRLGVMSRLIIRAAVVEVALVRRWIVVWWRRTIRLLAAVLSLQLLGSLLLHVSPDAEANSS